MPSAQSVVSLSTNPCEGNIDSNAQRQETSLRSTQISSSTSQQSGEYLESFHEQASIAEVSLLRAVILQAIIDTMSNSKRTEEKVAKADASNWFDMKNSDFKMICELSGWSADWVLSSTKKATARPETWRRNHGRYNCKNNPGE